MKIILPVPTRASVLQRLQSGDGPDVRLDAEIWVLTTAWPEGTFAHPGYGGATFTKTPEKPRAGMGRWTPAPEFTASVDTTLKLVERLLPGMPWRLLSDALHESPLENIPRAILTAFFHALPAGDA